MKKYFNQKQSHANLCSAVESGDHSKNGASPKSLTSRGNPFIFFKPAVFLAVFILLGSMYTVYAQTVSLEDVERYIVRAQSAYERGDFNKALAEYKEAQKLMPQYPELYKAIGDVYEKLGGTANLAEAIVNYKHYLKLVPQADDFKTIQKKIWELEEFSEETSKQDAIFDDLNGEWVSINNVQIVKLGNRKTGTLHWATDFIFKIVEVGKTGKYRVTIQSENCMFYTESIIDKTVNIAPAKDNSITFTFADAQAHTPNQGGYEMARLGLRVLGEVAGVGSIAQDIAQTTITATQLNDLPNNTQAAYIFELKYEDGKLKGWVNIRSKFSDPTKQKTTKDELYEITFIKKTSVNFDQELKTAIANGPDNVFRHKRKVFDRYGEKLSKKELYDKLHTIDPKLGKRYKKYNRNKLETGIMIFGGLGMVASGAALMRATNYNEYYPYMLMYWGSLSTISGSIWRICLPSRFRTIIKTYNNQVVSNFNKNITELHFGITPSGGFGLTLNF
jgi:tetratricopeptide (TPR) repeat protein